MDTKPLIVAVPASRNGGDSQNGWILSTTISIGIFAFVALPLIYSGGGNYTLGSQTGSLSLVFGRSESGDVATVTLGGNYSALIENPNVLTNNHQVITLTSPANVVPPSNRPIGRNIYSPISLTRTLGTLNVPIVGKMELTTNGSISISFVLNNPADFDTIVNSNLTIPAATISYTINNLNV